MSDSRETRLNDGSDLQVASWEDFGIQFDDEGNAKTVDQRVPGSERKIVVKPVIDIEPVSDVLEAENPDDERVDEVAAKHIVDGPGSEGDLSKGPDYVIIAILQAIKNSSGNEFRLAAEKQQLQEEVELIRTVGADNIENLAKLGQDTNNKQQ